MIDFENVYDMIDKMQGMKRYKAPEKGYFPTVAEINTYAHSKEFPHMIPYLLWLDDALTAEDRKVHKEAVLTLKRIIETMSDSLEDVNAKDSEPS